MTPADLIWNRACEGGGPNPCNGDRALCALLKAHGLAVNGGVLHAVECLSASELSDAQAGYRVYGLDAAASLLVRAKAVFDADDDLEFHEAKLDRDYAEVIPDDSSLVARFEEHLRSHPSEYAPIRAEDRG